MATKYERIQEFFTKNNDINYVDIIHFVIDFNAIIGVGLVSMQREANEAIWAEFHEIDEEV